MNDGGGGGGRRRRRRKTKKRIPPKTTSQDEDGSEGEDGSDEDGSDSDRQDGRSAGRRRRRCARSALGAKEAANRAAAACAAGSPRRCPSLSSARRRPRGRAVGTSFGATGRGALSVASLVAASLGGGAGGADDADDAENSERVQVRLSNPSSRRASPAGPPGVRARWFPRRRRCRGPSRSVLERKAAYRRHGRGGFAVAGHGEGEPRAADVEVHRRRAR